MILKTIYYLLRDFPYYFKRKIKRSLGIYKDPSTISYNDAVYFYWQRRKRYVELVESVLPYLPHDPIIVDVGANIGFFSSYLILNLPHFRLLYLFEPIVNLSDHCKQTFKYIERGERIIAFPCILGEVCKFDKLYLSADGNIDRNTMIKEKTKKDMKVIDITVMNYEFLNLQYPDFIKIAIEGAEHTILKCFYDMIRDRGTLKAPVILCEIGWWPGNPNYDSLKAIVEDYLKLGYRLTNLKSETISFEAMTQTQNVLFLPE